MRYFHFILATIAIASLFAAGWFGRKGFDMGHLPEFSRAEIKTIFFRVALIVSLMQFIIGPALLLSLPVHGHSLTVWLLILTGASVALVFLWILWKELKGVSASLNRNYIWILALLTVTATFMAFGRHYYRERAVAPHHQAMMAKTERFMWDSRAAQSRARLGLTKTVFASAGEKDFKANCAACHAPAATVVGPSLQEIKTIYDGKPEMLVAWAKAPGVKRGGVAMPAFAHLDDKVLAEIAEYMLSQK